MSTTGAPAGGEDRVLTLPNAVTVVRLAMLPVFLWLLLHDRPHHWYAAGWVLAVMGGTDWVDGYLARRLHQISTVGKILDPVADRALLLGGVGAILAVGAAPAWVAVLTLAREAIVAVTVVVLASMGARRIDVTWWGKAAACALMIAFPLFLAGHSTVGWRHVGEDMAWLAAIPGLIFGLYSLALYIPLARAALAEGKAGRLAGTGATP